MYIFNISETSVLLHEKDSFQDNINVFMQFFIHPNCNRQLEFITCLRKNTENPLITHIYLLNEQIYDVSDFGPHIDTSKIIQVNISHRLKYSDVFYYINANNVTGFNIIINSDIFLDDTIANLFHTDLHLQKKMYALLRYDILNLDPLHVELFGPRPDSQDCWIIHSNFHITNHEAKIFNFELGMPGCDNKLLYLMQILGFQVLNDPDFIKTYHLHNTQIRNYTDKDRLNDPYALSIPQLYTDDTMLPLYTKYNIFHCNTLLFNYLSQKIANHSSFIIPRFGGVESNLSIFVALSNNKENPQRKELLKQIPQMFYQMKSNTGIQLSSLFSAQRYAELYLHAFYNCEIYANWCPNDNVYKVTHQPVIEHLFPTKETIYALTFDIFNFIHHTPWTLALRGKRLLFISPFEDLIQQRIAIRQEIYGIDLFPDCEILTIKPPQTQGFEKSMEFNIELNKFFEQLFVMLPHFDIALVSAGGYGNIICDQLFQMGKSAIYIGGVLQMYWGIFGQRWLHDRPDIIRLYMNSHWCRPRQCDRPSNFKHIENGCYW
jgi:hypothetical protein